jgi:hypothetical protein
MTQDWGLRITHLTLDRDLRLHVYLTEPCPKDGDGRGWDDKHRGEVHHGDKLDQYGSTDLDEPREAIGYGAVHWTTGVSHFVQAPKAKKLTGTDVLGDTSDHSGRRGRV